jgi:hypothetical protein
MSIMGAGSSAGSLFGSIFWPINPKAPFCFSATVYGLSDSLLMLVIRGIGRRNSSPIETTIRITLTSTEAQIRFATNALGSTVGQLIYFWEAHYSCHEIECFERYEMPFGEMHRSL